MHFRFNSKCTYLGEETKKKHKTLYYYKIILKAFSSYPHEFDIIWNEMEKEKSF